MIESALRPPGPGARERERPPDRRLPSAPSSRGISGHRKTLEGEGAESGREVHSQYRKEVIQMKRELAELQATDPRQKDATADETWLERLGEKLGDYLAEPSMLQILLVILGILLMLLFALGVALDLR